MGPIKVVEQKDVRDYTRICIDDELTGKIWRIERSDNRITVEIPDDFSVIFNEYKDAHSLKPRVYKLETKNIVLKRAGKTVVISGPKFYMKIAGPVIKFSNGRKTFKLISSNLAGNILKKIENMEPLLITSDEYAIEKEIQEILDSLKDAFV